jgi:hypothetical protein
MKELQFRIEPYGTTKSFYSFEYRWINTGFWKILNWFIPFKILCRTYHIGSLNRFPDRNHPMLYSRFDDAKTDAIRFKNNPALLEDFILKENEKHDRIYLECEEYSNNKNQRAII